MWPHWSLNAFARAPVTVGLFRCLLIVHPLVSSSVHQRVPFSLKWPVYFPIYHKSAFPYLVFLAYVMHFHWYQLGHFKYLLVVIVSSQEFRNCGGLFWFWVSPLLPECWSQCCGLHFLVPSPSLGVVGHLSFPLLHEYTVALSSLLSSPVWIRAFPLCPVVWTWSNSTKYLKSLGSSLTIYSGAA